jgi:hypothetical protein
VTVDKMATPGNGPLSAETAIFSGSKRRIDQVVQPRYCPFSTVVSRHTPPIGH